VCVGLQDTDSEGDLDLWVLSLSSPQPLIVGLFSLNIRSLLTLVRTSLLSGHGQRGRPRLLGAVCPAHVTALKRDLDFWGLFVQLM